jgi:succinate dehydrogenase/fumarate reductase flavoprotein subunit
MPPAEYPEEPFIRKFLSLPNPRNVWVVTDAAQAEEMKWPVNEIANPEPMRGRGLDPKSCAVAGTLDELADKMGVHKANFLDTVQRYNGFAATGTDEDFGKAEPMFPIAKGPFYGLKMNIIRHTPPGGLRINTKGQVLDRAGLWDGTTATHIDAEPVIPHLYAGGECAAFVGWRRAHRKTGPILTMGRITGIAVAREPLI